MLIIHIEPVKKERGEPDNGGTAEEQLGLT